MQQRTAWQTTMGIVVLLFFGGAVAAGWASGEAFVGDDVVRVGAFSDMDPSRPLPEGWRVLSLAAAFDKTNYGLVRTAGTTVVRAQSNDAAAGLGTEHRVDLKAHPILEWRWKVDRLVEDGDVRVKSKEDCSACLFVVFDYNDLSLVHRLQVVTMRALGYDAVPTRTVTYVWANRADRHTVVPSAYAPWIRQVPLRSGTTHVGTWKTERRNVLADYRAIYGEAPPPIRGVGIMTDTDNTDGVATAYYGDIVFRPASPDSVTETIGTPLRFSAAQDTATAQGAP